jgi:hypothetical protein
MRNAIIGKIEDFRITKGKALYTDKSYCKYLKRVKNRNKLYDKLRKLGR